MTAAADFSWLHVLFACCVVLLLLAGLNLVLRYFSTHGMALSAKTLRDKRLKIVESLAIDPKRRFVIVSCDNREHLLLIGGNNDIVVDTNLPSPQPSKIS